MYKVLHKKNKNVTTYKGGHSNAFLSMLLPGFGDYFVYEGQKKWIASGTSENGGPYDKNGVNKSDYVNYMILYGGIASAIWFYDVINVTVQGYKNKREQSGYSYNNSKSKLYFVCTPNNYQIGFIKKF